MHISRLLIFVALVSVSVLVFGESIYPEDGVYNSGIGKRSWYSAEDDVWRLPPNRNGAVYYHDERTLVVWCDLNDDNDSKASERLQLDVIVKKCDFGYYSQASSGKGVIRFYSLEGRYFMEMWGNGEIIYVLEMFWTSEIPFDLRF